MLKNNADSSIFQARCLFKIYTIMLYFVVLYVVQFDYNVDVHVCAISDGDIIKNAMCLFVCTRMFP